jgi:hypothetical protein
VPTKKEKQPLSVTHPELAKEADGWDPSAVTMGSNKKINWKCSKGHVWATSPNARTNNHLGCPVCSGYKVLAGYNDLATTFPEVAAEADGWDPTEFIAGSRKKMPWTCPKGHKYLSSITHRTRSQSGCSICSNTIVLPGYNDLATFFPDIGKQAEGWDPTTVTAGSNKKRKWKCEDGHVWESTPNLRTGQNQGCSVCANMQLLKGYNDLATTFPEVAAEADGWDPTELIAGSNKRLAWKCSLGHRFFAKLNNRTSSMSKCPVCSNKQLLVGFNDFASRYPALASEADGWDPSTVFPGSHVKKKWICEKNHRYEASLNNRTKPKGSTCPVCANIQVLSGYNDLATTFPEVAAEADGWDPTKVLGGSAAKKKWRCSMGHKYVATLHSRTTNQTGCPSCSVTGFDPNKDGWLYFMEHERFGYLQIGITNFPDDRLKLHSKFGWVLLQLRGPMDGHLAANWETSILRMLRAKNAQMGPGKAGINKISNADSKAFVGTEMWLKESFQANSINDLMRLTEEFEGN